MEEIKLKIKRGKEDLLKILIRNSELFVFETDNTLEPMNIDVARGADGEKRPIAYFTKKFTPINKYGRILLYSITCKIKRFIRTSIK